MKNPTFVAELHKKLGAPSSETVESLRLLKAFPGGTITVRYVNGNLAWTWLGQAGGKQYNAIAVLTR